MDSRNILICEDEAIVAEDIRASLEEHGYKVSAIADSAERAMEAVQQVKPDLVLMDICLKGDTNGIEAARNLRKDHGVPVIFLTSLSDNETLNQAKASDPMGYITKPFRGSELKSAIEIGLYRHSQQVELNKQVQKSKARLNLEIDKSNVTEKLLELQKQMIEAQKMDAIRSLAGGIAHHVNNTLCAVVGTLQYLSQTISSRKELGHEENGLIQSVLEKCDRTALIIKNLLSFSEKNSFPKESVTINQLVSDATREVAALLGNKANIRTAYVADEMFLQVDRKAVVRCISEVIINACDALSATGTVSVQTDLEYQSGEQEVGNAPGWYGVIKVTDNGYGMSEAALKRVFEPFFTTKNDGHSLGLGLSMAYVTMQKHGGWIAVDSVEGVGTSVRLFFPCI